MDYFWTNTVWYVLLGFITIVQLIFVLSKAKSPGTALALYLTVTGMALAFETIILIYLKAYTYYPKILQNPFDDALAGNLFSQFSVGASITMVAVLNLTYYWFFILAGLYGIIEEGFLSLGLYKHNWYRTWMTVSILPFAFWMGKYLYKKFIQGLKPWTYYLYILFALFPLYVVSFNWTIMLLGLRTYSTTAFSILSNDPVINRYSLALIYFSILALSFMGIYFYKTKWYRKTAVVISLYLITYIGYKFDLLQFKPGWFLPVTTLSFLWLYGSIYITDKLYDYNSKNST